MPLEKSVAHAFPTLIGQFRVPAEEHAGVNAELRRVVLEKEKTVPDDRHANAGGWHSGPDLLEWPGPAVRVLRDWIAEAINHMIRATLEYMAASGMPRPFGGSVQLAAWANVIRRGNFHRLHNHPGNCWSGVYYVDGGGGGDAAFPLSGTLELIDPRPFAEMTFTPGEPYGQRVLIRPQPGLLVLFPSFLYHLVNPYHGDGERISVAFNAKAVEGNRPGGGAR